MKMTAIKRLISLVLALCMVSALFAGTIVSAGAVQNITSDRVSDVTAVYTYVENDDVLGDLQIDGKIDAVNDGEFMMFNIYQNVEDIADPTNGRTNLPVTTKGFYLSSLAEGNALSKKLQLTPLKLDGKCVLGAQISNLGEDNDWVYEYITTALKINPNGGELVGDDSVQVKLGFSILKEIEGKDLVKRDYYDLVGWSEEPNGTPIAEDFLMTQYGDEIYALWEQRTSTITFNPNGGKGEMPPQIVAQGDTITLDSNQLENDDDSKFFEGWATESDGPVVYHDGDEIVVTDDTLELYAVWGDKNEVKIIFDGYGATSGSMEPLVGVSGETANLSPNLFAKDNSSFAGWSETAGGEVKYSNKEEITFGANDITLYAVWTQKTIKVLYSPNGGEGYKKPEKYTEGSTITLAANVFTFKGQVFAGWSLDPNGEILYKDCDTVVLGNAPLTLYAIWKGDTRAILYNPNGGTGYIEPTKGLNTGDKVTLAANTFTRDGYVFKGWATTIDGEVVYADKASVTVGDTNIALYAVWALQTKVKAANTVVNALSSIRSFENITDALAIMRLIAD